RQAVDTAKLFPALNIAIRRRWKAWRDTRGDQQVALCGGVQRGSQSPPKLVVPRDERVRVNRRPRRLRRARLDVQGGEEQRRRRTPPRRLDDDARVRQLRQLRPQGFGVRVLGDDQDAFWPDERQHAVDRLL